MLKEWQQYRDRVREAITLRNGEPILNGSINHASIIAEEAFNCARRTVQILTHKLDQGCYGDGVKSSARAFLADPEHKVRILIESSLWDAEGNFEWDEHPFIAGLREFMSEDKGERLEVRLVPKDWASRYSFNFLLLDDYGYRYEANRENSAAVAAFFPRNKVAPSFKNLETLYGKLWQASAPLKLGALVH